MRLSLLDDTVVKTLFFDVDTQLDFLYQAGALHFSGAEDIVKSLAELTNFAGANRIQIISDVDAHSEDDPEFKIWKPHCVVGTAGQQKAACTLLTPRIVLSTAPGAIDRIRADVHDARQIILEKQTLDCFTNPNLPPLLDILNADRYVVYGVATEICVQCAAFGLLKTGAQIELVTDAIKGISASDEREMIQRFEAQGGRLTTVAAVTA
jgi:nicotinamidase/pyrazinamidase